MIDGSITLSRGRKSWFEEVGLMDRWRSDIVELGSVSDMTMSGMTMVSSRAGSLWAGGISDYVQSHQQQQQQPYHQQYQQHHHQQQHQEQPYYQSYHQQQQQQVNYKMVPAMTCPSPSVSMASPAPASRRTIGSALSPLGPVMSFPSQAPSSPLARMGAYSSGRTLGDSMGGSIEQLKQLRGQPRGNQP